MTVEPDRTVPSPVVLSPIRMMFFMSLSLFNKARPWAEFGTVQLTDAFYVSTTNCVC
jgi:hypothetical protein